MMRRRPVWNRGAPGLVVLLLSLGLGACAKAPEEIRSPTAGERPSDREVDEDPWRLLPPGAVAWFRTDKEIWSAEFADDLISSLNRFLPLPQSAGVDPKRDIELIVGAFYASVQNDTAFVAQGQFDPEKLNNALAASTSSAGDDVFSVTFAGETMYVKDNVGLALLTNRTLVFGTQLGVRRVLEVVEENRMRRNLPDWFETMLTQPGAHLQLGGDLDSQPIPSVLRTKLTFLNHLRAARLVGNYKGGGVNLAGALTFDTPAAAAEAERQFETAQDELDRYRIVMNALSMPEPFRSIQGKATGKDTQFGVEVEAEMMSFLMLRGEEFFGQFLGEESSSW